MTGTGRYIGTPNGIVLCVDRKTGGIIEGRLYHGYSSKGHPFRGYEDIIKTAEELFNTLGFPHTGAGDRDRGILSRNTICRKKHRSRSQMN